MKKALFKTKKLLILSLVMSIVLISAAFTISSFAETDVWTFTSASVKDPLYVQKHFTELPGAFEAEVNFTSAQSSASPIISNWPNSDTRESFGFQITNKGEPCLYYYDTTYNTAEAKVVSVKAKAIFDYDVVGKGWVRLSVACETVDGSPVYNLYVDGVLTDTITDLTTMVDIDPIYSQTTTRELSIGNDGKNHFKGQLRNVAVYKTLTAEDAAKTAKENMQSGNTSLMAYYDATMSGNYDKFIKDQTGNGHDAYSAFFERKTALGNYDYSFAFIGDTQFLVEKDVNDGTTKYASPIFDWIVQNKDSKKIARVFGLGDITDNNADAEWEYAVTLYEKLGAAGIDYSLVNGNHDDYTTPAAKYNKYFGKVSSFVNSIDGYYQEGRLENFYTKFEVGTHKYMVIGLLYGAKDDVLAWANEVVAENSDRQVIVITHSLYDAAGNWAVADTSAQTTTSRKELNNGIDIWNKFISRHSNIIIAAAGHISGDVIKAGKSVGVNGNVVNTFLINPQGFDYATGFDTGMVAMFYFSNGGSTVNVEYVSTIKTLRAQSADESSDDILYHEKNIFTFTVGETDGDMIKTEYGNLPGSMKTENNFAVFCDGALVSAHTTWKAATKAAADIFSADSTKNVTILLLHDYTNTSDPLTNNAANLANGTLTIDLGGNTFVRSDTFLNLTNNADLSNIAPANITVKNGSVRSATGKPIIDNQITNTAYTAEKVWNVTFDGVTVGFTSGVTSFKGLLYQAWTNAATADDTQLGTKVNILFNGCTFDLKTDAPEDGATLFALRDDHSGIDKIDVNVRVAGGTILANAENIGNFTFYTLNAGNDSFTFTPDSKGKYIKLKTNTTAVDFAHYAGTYPTSDGNMYFVETADNGKESTYELKSLTVTYKLLNGSTMTTAISLGSSNADAKYLSEVDYPFVLFDQTGKFYSGRSTFLNDAINSAIYHISNSDSKPSEKTAYILMRRDYTMTSTEKQDNLSHGREHGIVIDMQGYAIIADSTRSGDIFDSTIKQWTGSKDEIYSFATSYYVRNGTFKTHSARVLYFKASNGSDISTKHMSWTFENVSFELLSGASVNRFFHVANASKTSASIVAPVTLTLNDCTFDLTKNTSSANPFTIIRCNFGASSAKIKGTVNINGGKVLANTLNKAEVLNYVEGNGFSLTYGPGEDGSYFSVYLPSSADASSIIGMSCKATDGKTYTFDKVTTGMYSLYFETSYGRVPLKYADIDKYPYLAFQGGEFLELGNIGYDAFIGNTGAFEEALRQVKAGGAITIMMRKSITVSAEAEFLTNYQTCPIVLDLMDYTIDASAVSSLFTSDGTQNLANTLTVKNGSLVIGGSLITVANRPDADGRVQTFILEKLSIVLYGTDLIAYNTADTTNSGSYSFDFIDCDITLNCANPTVFNANSANGLMATSIRVIGGAMTFDGGFDALHFVIENEGCAVTFLPDGNGDYTVVRIKGGTAQDLSEIYTTDNGLKIFALSTTEDGYGIYLLATPNLTVAPLISLTLYTDFVYNVYIPVKDYITSITLGNSVYTDLAALATREIGGVAYYHLTEKVGVTEAGNVTALVIEAEFDSQSFTVSVIAYASSILAGENALVEKTLASDILSYIRSAYAYADINDGTVEKIDAIIGADYDENNEATLPEARMETLGLASARFMLSETPYFVFYPELDESGNPVYSLDSYVFSLDGKYRLESYVTEIEGKTAFVVKSYAFAVDNDIVYFIDGTSVRGTYNVGAYYEFATELADAELIALIERLVKYAESAEAYRSQF